MTDQLLTVLHLTGSPTSDFFADLSRLYAADCLEAVADADRYRFVLAYLTPDGAWRFPPDLTSAGIAGAAPYGRAEAIAHLVRLRVDVAVPQLFCLPGMTTYRALLDVLGIPYVGNAPDVMALGARKPWAKALVAAAGVRTPASQVVAGAEAVQVPTPAVVKPVDADNSAGVTLVTDSAGYPEAVTTALAHSDQALVERYVPLGREVRCGVLDLEGDLVCLPLEEYRVDSHTKPIRDAADKLARDNGQLTLVAKNATYAGIVDLDDPVTASVWDAARRCHTALGCRDYSLFDFRIDPEGRPYFLEASLYWSFAQQSVLSTMSAAHGLHLPDLFQRLIGTAYQRL